MRVLERVLPVAAQVSGAAAAVAGLYLLAGLAWTLAVTGVAALAVGTLAEARGGA